MILPSNKIYISQSKIENADRGVFADTNIKEGDLIETCPVIETRLQDYAHLKKTKLRDYYFMWDKNNKKVAICLGFGSMYNHSYSPNATYKKNFKENIVNFIAIKNISKDEEITVNYNSGNPDDKSKLWIESIPSSS